MRDTSGAVDPVRFEVLGRLAVTAAGRPLQAGPPKQRLLLAVLLCRANHVVSTDRLTEALWHQAPPRTARKNLQVYVTALRKAVGDRIDYLPPGYLIRVEPEELDLARFENFAEAGRRLLRQGDPHGAIQLLEAAVRCWTGPPLAEFADAPLAQEESERLFAKYLAVYEDWAEVRCDLGQHAQILESVDEVLAQHPFRERLGVAKMTALAGCGRTVEALAYFDDVRQHMARELGIDPSPVLTGLYRRLLRGTAAPAAARRPAAAAGAGACANQLPRDVPDFVGRAEQLETLLNVLGDPRSAVDVAVLTGPLCTGKTALAVRAGHLLKDHFADGLMLGALCDDAGLPRKPHEVAAQLLRDAGVPESAIPAGAQAGALWRSWLAGRTVLLVLDGAVDEGTVRALLPGSGGSRVIVTSRRKLSGLEAVLRVELGSLTDEEALDLLARLIGPDRTLDDPGSARRLVAHCGAVPLALRVLGTKLAMMRHVPLDWYAKRLTDDRVLFEELAVGDVSVRARLEEFLRGLPSDCGSALVALARTAGPVFGREALLTALYGGEAPAERMFAELVEDNLLSVPEAEVTAHGEAYALPALVYRYLRALAAAARTTARARPAGAATGPAPG